MSVQVIFSGESLQECKNLIVKGAGDLIAYGLVPKFENSDKDSHGPEGLIHQTAKETKLPPPAEAKIEAAVETAVAAKRGRGRPPTKTADIAADMKTEATVAAQVVDIEPKQVATPSPAPAPVKTIQMGVVERDGMLQALNQVFVKKGVNTLKGIFKTMGVPGHNSITTPEQIAQAIQLAGEALEG